MPTSEASAQRECHSSWRICRWYGREASAGSERAQAPLLFLSLASPALSSHLRPATSGSFLCPSKWSLRSVALPKACFLHHWLAPCQTATPPHLWGVTVGWAMALGSGFSKSRFPVLPSSSFTRCCKPMNTPASCFVPPAGTKHGPCWASLISAWDNQCGFPTLST